MERNNHGKIMPPPLPGADRSKLRADSNSGINRVGQQPVNEDGGREVFDRSAVLAEARSAAEAGKEGGAEIFDRAEVLRQAEQSRVLKLKKFVADHPNLAGTKVPFSADQSAELSKFFPQEQVEAPPLGWATAVYEGDVPENVLRKIDLLPPDEQQKAIDDWYATSGNETAEEKTWRKLREKGEFHDEVVKMHIKSRESGLHAPEKPKRPRLSTEEEVARIKADIKARDAKLVEEIAPEYVEQITPARATPPKVTPEIKHGKLVSKLNALFEKWKNQDQKSGK